MEVTSTIWACTSWCGAAAATSSPATREWTRSSSSRIWATRSASARSISGVRIEIGVEGIRPDAAGKSLFHCAMGLIHYESSPMGGETGYLLYIKPSTAATSPPTSPSTRPPIPSSRTSPPATSGSTRASSRATAGSGGTSGRRCSTARSAADRRGEHRGPVRAPAAPLVSAEPGHPRSLLAPHRAPARASRRRSAATRISRFSTRRSIRSGSS